MRFGDAAARWWRLSRRAARVLAFVSKSGVRSNRRRRYVRRTGPSSTTRPTALKTAPCRHVPAGSTFTRSWRWRLELGKRHATQHDPRPGLLRVRRPALRDSKAAATAWSISTVDRRVLGHLHYQVANDLGIDAIAGFMKHFASAERTGTTAGEPPGCCPAGMEDGSASAARAAEVVRRRAISIGIGQG